MKITKVLREVDELIVQKSNSSVNMKIDKYVVERKDMENQLINLSRHFCILHLSPVYFLIL